MNACLRLISLTVLLWAAVVPASAAALTVGSDSLTRTAVRIERGRMSVTGLCLMKRTGDSICGTVVNEFGIKAFDFVVVEGKKRATLQNVVAFLDKWYIRKTLAADFGFLFSADLTDGKAETRRRALSSDGQTTVLRNKRRNITYTFTHLKENRNNETDK